jgi:cyclophilin family peptidyl-prolyl cis-trans isomerase
VFVALVFLVAGASAGPLVQFRTTVGDFSVELYDRDKPITVQNFLRYVTNGAYTDCLFHRSVGGLIIQGGGYRVRDRASPTNYTVYAITPFAPIKNEFLVGPLYSNVYGTIAMAKTANPDSATSQFFFNLSNNTELNDTNNSGGFTVFGRVIDGTNILDRLNVNNPSSAIAIVNAGGTFANLPVLKSFAGPLIESDELVYLDVSVLMVSVELKSGGCQISWNSVSNIINRVEYTTNLPPVWWSLFETNGNGGRMQVVDSSRDSPWRFYRVRIGDW